MPSEYDDERVELEFLALPFCETFSVSQTLTYGSLASVQVVSRIATENIDS